MAAVSGVFNAVFITGDNVGDLMFYGRGAGQLPTASAVWSDTLEIARRVAHGIPAMESDLPSLSERPLPLRRMEDIRSSYYLRVMAMDRVDIERGDMLVLHTGFTGLVMQMNRDPDPSILDHACACLDGRDEKLLQWITDSGVAAICADNYAVELYPAKPQAGERPALPLHQHCLFKLGVPLAELWWLKDLAAWLRAHQRSRFLLTAPPLRLPGAVGSPTTPVATV